MSLQLFSLLVNCDDVELCKFWFAEYSGMIFFENVHI